MLSPSWLWGPDFFILVKGLKSLLPSQVCLLLPSHMYVSAKKWGVRWPSPKWGFSDSETKAILTPTLCHPYPTKPCTVRVRGE